MIKLLTCHSCGKKFEFETTRGGQEPEGCSNYCKNRIKRLKRKEKEKQMDKGLPTVEDILDSYQKKNIDFNKDPNMEKGIYFV
jgi:hypothetical protein